MTPTNEKAAEGQTQAALDKTHGQINHTDRVDAAQLIRDVAKLCYKNACEESPQICGLRGGDEKSKGLLILRLYRSWLVHGQIASRMEAR